MELVPRISRAQSMDALSSQALVSGYRCAIVAAGLLRRFFPLNMTAAGTVQPAQVVVLGAGVAGLQAIATSKRLGAVVQAYDVRAAAAEEIRSMGAKSIDLELETLEGSGGYAREMTEDRAARQRELLDAVHRQRGRADHHRRRARPDGADAGDRRDGRADEARLRRGRPRRRDAAATSRDRWPARSSASATRRSGAGTTCPSQMPGPASKLYAQNVVNLLTLMTHEGEFAPDFDDEVVAGAAVTHAGRIVHEPTRRRSRVRRGRTRTEPAAPTSPDHRAARPPLRLQEQQ